MMSSARIVGRPSESEMLSVKDDSNICLLNNAVSRMRGGGDAEGIELLADSSTEPSKYRFDRYARNPLIYKNMKSKLATPKINRKVDTLLRKVHEEKIWTRTNRKPSFPGEGIRFRRSSRKRKSIKPKPEPEPQPELDMHEQFNACVGVIHAAMYWRWRASEQRHLSHSKESEPWLPQHLHARKPTHSTWSWNAKHGCLHWRSNRQNPVEDWYNAAATADDHMKNNPGLFGKRYKKFPNEATWAPLKNDAGIYQRARPRAGERDIKESANSLVTLADIKEVAEKAVGQFFPIAYGRRQFSNIPEVDSFLMSLIEYFHFYFYEKRIEETLNLRTCMLYDTAGKEERKKRMDRCLAEAGRSYAKFILGRGMPFHHADGDAFGTISATSADQQFWEAFYAFAIQVVWITFAKPQMNAIVREMGRIFRGLYFDPARREGEDDVYKHKSYRRSAVKSHGFKRSRSHRRTTTEQKGSAAKIEGSIATQQDFIATCLIIDRVYGQYVCPPMPPKAVYALLNNKSALVNSVLGDDPSQQKASDSLVDRERIGILGEPQHLFDANLDPIDLIREHKYMQLKFLGPITARERGSRIADKAPFLLQPTPPKVDDIARFK